MTVLSPFSRLTVFNSFEKSLEEIDTVETTHSVYISLRLFHVVICGGSAFNFKTQLQKSNSDSKKVNIIVIKSQQFRQYHNYLVT